MSLRISTAPHMHNPLTTQRLMQYVFIALLPTAAWGVYAFGLPALAVLLLSTASAVAAEFMWQKIAKQPVRVGDFSALVTGLILGLNLPATAPWWMVVIGSVFAIIIVKQLFGGLGDNFLNPALAARAVLLASWPTHMAAAAYVNPTFFQAGVDAVSTSTPPGRQGFLPAAIVPGPNSRHHRRSEQGRHPDWLPVPALHRRHLLAHPGGDDGQRVRIHHADRRRRA